MSAGAVPEARLVARTIALISDLRALPAETSWVEFKENKKDAQLIGKLISALSNAARLADQPFAYLIWGVRDGDHAAVGTNFQPSAETQNNQPLELWLAQHLQPSINFTFEPIDYQDVRLVVLKIPAAPASPVEFDRTAFIRIGSATPRLSDYPERLRALWAKLQPYVWESGLAAQFLTGDEVLARLNYTAYFDLTGQPLPDSRWSAPSGSSTALRVRAMRRWRRLCGACGCARSREPASTR